MTVNPSRIRQARLNAGLSQDGLARAAGTSTRNVARWESGRHTPRPEFVAAIAEATGRELTFFFTEEGSDEEEDEAALAVDLLNLMRRVVNRQETAA